MPLHHYSAEEPTKAPVTRPPTKSPSDCVRCWDDDEKPTNSPVADDDDNNDDDWYDDDGDDDSRR